ncbi:MAG: 30S ribosomal protein S7 [Deltaproteobacteria bacterium]|nr:30S ribosomal protein S7 [Deltaproteobacteria bacterium]
MPRRRDVPKRFVAPDRLYNDPHFGKFINIVMKQGKKSTAEKICYGALDILKQKEKEEPIEIFKKALKNVRPQVEVKARRVGGSNYQVPVEVPNQRGYALAMRWIVEAAGERGENSMVKKLAAELAEAAQNTGIAIKKKDEVHRMAEANKAFAHYRW